MAEPSSCRHRALSPERLVIGLAVALAVLLTMTGLSPAGRHASHSPTAPVPTDALWQSTGVLPPLEVPRPQPAAPGVKAAGNTIDFREPLRKAPLGGGLTPASPSCIAYPLEPGQYRVSSPYGFRRHPIFGRYLMHAGIDLAAPLGTPIHAVAEGTVVYSGGGRLGRSSELVIIEHRVGETTFYSWYVHMYPEDVAVSVGDSVRAGEVIARVGNNGNSTGPHLHFEIHLQDPGLGLDAASRGVSPAAAVSELPETPSPEGTEEESSEETEDEADNDPEDGDDGEEVAEDGDQPEGAEEDGEDDGAGDEEIGEGDPGKDESEEEVAEESVEESPDTLSPDEESPPTGEESGPSPSPSPTPEMTDAVPAPENAPPSPPQRFPNRAFGTTVNPLVFLTELAGQLRAPSYCGAQWTR